MTNAFWMETLACPRCREALRDPSRCSYCRTDFPAADGVPCLIARGATCEVRFDYAPDEGATEHLLSRVLTEPPPYAGSDHLPYHLDPVQARCIAACPAGSRVLEIGCGGGQNRRWVQGHGLRYVGTDISRTRVFEWLREYGGPDLLCDAHFLPFRNEQFDVVYSAAVTEHLACPQRVVQEVFRVLKPGGYFLSNVSFLEPWHDNSYYHMTPLGVLELLTRPGFAVEHIWPGRGYSGFQALPAMAFRRPFKVLRHLGRAAQWVYRLQHMLKSLGRRLRGRSPDSLIHQRAVVAGAIDWIARRPGVAAAQERGTGE